MLVFIKYDAALAVDYDDNTENHVLVKNTRNFKILFMKNKTK